ncbi:MAG: hypothetical protein HY722_02285, partial [Planctomycetes bacterium]|nr:hypothetical protein [Planctomycetota bacterium]
MRSREARRPPALVLGGILAPLAAFAMDSLLRVNPVAWGGVGFRGGMGLAVGMEGAGLRPLAVHALAGLSLLG